MDNNSFMNKNEQCLINYLSYGKYEQDDILNSLVKFLMNKGIKFSFNNMNPVLNIIDEMEFFDNIKYN